MQERKATTAASHGSIRLHCRRMAVLVGEDVPDRAEPLVEAALLDVAAGLSTGDHGSLTLTLQVPCLQSHSLVVQSHENRWLVLRRKCRNVSVLVSLGLPSMSMSALDHSVALTPRWTHRRAPG